MNRITWNKNILTINKKITTFDYKILEVKTIDDFVLVVLVPESDLNNNLFGVSIRTGEMWQVQSVTDKYPDFSPTPFVGINVLQDNVIVALDFCGCRFKIRPSDGEIIGRASSVK